MVNNNGIIHENGLKKRIWKKACSAAEIIIDILVEERDRYLYLVKIFKYLLLFVK